MSKKTPSTATHKLTKSQVRRMEGLIQFYQSIHKYSLREEAYATVLKIYIAIKKKVKPPSKNQSS